MDLEAKPYRAFVAVAEERSFSRAAERLNMSQPALSAQIREFERRLGFMLFTRTSRSVELTAQGRLFLGNARRMVTETQAANIAAREIRSNQLSIGAAIQTVLIAERQSLIERFMLQRPDVPLRVINRSDARHIAGLTRREIDLTLLIEPIIGGNPAYSPLDSSAAAAAELERLALMRRPVELLTPVESPLARHAVIPASALQGLQIAVIDRTHSIALTEAVSLHLRNAGADPVRPPERNAIAVERFGALMRMPALSLGWFGTAHLAGLGGMVGRPVEGLEIETSLTLLRARHEQRPAAAAFWEMAARAAGSSSNS